MLSYPLEVLQESELFNRIIVSTDDEEIAQIARDGHAEVPFMRPSELCDDYCGTKPIVAHAIRWLLDQGIQPKLVCCVYATTPLLSTKYLCLGLQSLEAQPTKSFAFSVTRFSYPIQRSLRCTSDGGVAPLFPEYIPCRSQDLEPAYHDAGQFYWGRTQGWLTDKSMFSNDAIPIILPRYRVQDIDDEEDWQQAELLYQLLNSRTL